eukprot:Phypoly_transcript_11318.p1 GENE.Phypoly_transcript_11318~~Phypoly_transcript_11318.p1  ORF type:complete len:321 (+),score=38.55 Phypoly_transcript_11318:215-1177(+)
MKVNGMGWELQGRRFGRLKEICKTSQVCKQLYDMANRDALWREFFPPWYKTTLNWKKEYIEKWIKPAKWIKLFSPAPYVVVGRAYLPETICIRAMYDMEGWPVFYTGGRYDTGLAQVYLVPDESHKGFNTTEVFSSLNLNPGCLANYGNLLAVGGTDSTISLVDTHKHPTLQNDSISGSMKLKTEMPGFSNCTWMYYPISQLQFSKSGQYLFSSSPGKDHGVVMWDVETQKEIHVFNHHLTGKWEMEEAMYGQRSKHEIYSVCPTHDGDQFFSGSYANFYHWDTRSGDLIKMHSLYQNIFFLAFLYFFFYFLLYFFVLQK